MQAKDIIAGCILGLGVIGGVSYFAAMSYLSNKTLASVHQQIETLSTQYHFHTEVTHEDQGRFNSNMQLVATPEDGSEPLNVTLFISHGLFSTNILAVKTGSRPLLSLDKGIDGASLMLMLPNKAIMRGDLKGSRISLVVEDPERHLIAPMLSAFYTNEGRLVVSGEFSSYNKRETGGRFYSSGPATLSLTYDAPQAERIVRAGLGYIDSGMPEKKTALYNELLSVVPDLHVEMKELKMQSSLRSHEYSADRLSMDVIADRTHQAATQITGTLSRFGRGTSRHDVAWDMALDHSVADTLQTIAHGQDSERLSPLLLSLMQSSPALVVKDLHATAEGVAPMSVSGTLRVNGKGMAALSDFSAHNVDVDMMLDGVSSDAVKDARANGLDDITLGQPVIIRLGDGHLHINRQTVF